MRWIVKVIVFTAALVFGSLGASLFGALAGSGLNDYVVNLSSVPVASSQPPKGVRVMYAGWWPESDERLAFLRFVVYNGLDVPVTYSSYMPTDALPEVRVDGKKYEQWRCLNGIEDFQIAPGASAEILATRWDFPSRINAHAQATVGLYLNLSPRPQPHRQNADILTISEPFTIPDGFRAARLP